MKPMNDLIGSHQSELLESIAEAIRSVSSKARGVPILPGSLLLDELALDSLDLVAVILDLQDRFQVEIDPDEITDLRTVDDLLTSIRGHLQAAA